MKPASFPPTVFFIIETFILLPSLIAVFGYLSWIFLRNPYLYSLIIAGGALQIIGCVFISPLAGGILAYGYLERFKATGWSAVLSKFILAYSIIQIGLAVTVVTASVFLIK